ncbi:unnamed protein product [Rotaria sp. Silwood2]|nr:unnamed protein product [Rotaria sp. Silwood2]
MNNNNMYIQRQYQPRRNNYYQQQQQQQNRIRSVTTSSRSIPKFIPIKIIRFRWGQKNGLIRPRPLPPTPLPRHNLPPPPPRTTYHHNHHYNRLNNNRYYQHRRYYNNNIKYTNTQNLPSLLELNPLPFTIT